MFKKKQKSEEETTQSRFSPSSIRKACLLAGGAIGVLVLAALAANHEKPEDEDEEFDYEQPLDDEQPSNE